MKINLKFLFLVLSFLVAVLIVLDLHKSSSTIPVKSLNRPVSKPLQSSSNDNKNKIRSICLSPLSLEVGQKDKQFELTNAEVVKVLQKAIDEWRDATGREWFRIEIGGSLKVNFLYDGRQSTLLEMKKEQAQLESEVAALKINPLSSKTEIASLLARIDSYRNKYEASVSPVPSAQHHSDRGGVSIDVFAFSSKEQLHATLLHELGHALGLGHLNPPDAIMNALQISQKSDAHLSQYDIEAALSLCEQR